MYITDTTKKYTNLRTCEYPEFIKAIDSKILGLMEEFIRAIDEVNGKVNNSVITGVTYRGNGIGEVYDGNGLQVTPTLTQRNFNDVYTCDTVTNVKVNHDTGSISGEWDGKTYLTGNNGNSNGNSKSSNVSVKDGNTRTRTFDTTEYIQEISNANNNNLQTSVTYGNGNGNGVNDGVDVKDKVDELKYRIEELYKIHEALDKMYMKYVLDGKTWEETKN